MSFTLDNLLNPLFDFLKCCLAFLVGCIEWVLITVANLLIFAVSGLLDLALLILPSVALPSITLPSSFAIANYFLPIDQLLLALTIVVSVLVVWPLVRLILNWVKAL